MAHAVDERIVQMQFNNRQFEKGIKTSLDSLNKLEKALHLDGITDSLQKISDRFSAFGIASMTIISDFTRSVSRAGRELIDKLYIDPARTGFSEYETQMNAIQTILANTSKDGVGIDKVNQKLDELNAYADKTIYNFSEMTRNIGTFTAAGVDIDTSVDAIKGIANLAAVSGSTSQQASTAMYQLSQALASGTVKLQDWNSVVNAGMGGEVFQDALKRTAKLMRSTLPKEAKAMYEKLEKGEISFRESLKAGWITDDILTHTLRTFTGDMTEDELLKLGYSNAEVEEIIKMGEMAEDAATKVKTLTQLFDTLKEAMGSGWAQSWELIVGDFEEAKELFTNISDYFSEAITKAAGKRNLTLKVWRNFGGRESLIQSFWNFADAVSNVKKIVSEAFKEFFPPMTGKDWADMTKVVEGFTEKIKALTEDSEFIDGVSKVVKKFSGTLKSIIDLGKRSALRIFDIGVAVKSMWDSFKETDGYKTVSKVFSEKLGPISTAYNWIKTTLEGYLAIIDAEIDAFIADPAAYAQRLSEKIQSIFTKAPEGEEGAEDQKGTTLLQFFQSLLPTWEEVCAFVEQGAGVIITKALELLKSFFKGAIDALKTFVGGLDGEITLTDIIQVLTGIKVLDIVTSIGSVIDSFSGLLEGFKEMLGSLGDFFESLGKATKNSGTFAKKIFTLGSIAVAMWFAAKAFETIGNMDFNQIGRGLSGMAGIMGEMYAFLFAVGKLKFSFSSILMTILGLIPIAIATNLLTIPVKVLGSMETEQMKQGLLGMAGVMGEMYAFLLATSLLKFSLSSLLMTVLGLIPIAIATNLLTIPVKVLGSMETEQMKQGLLGMAGVMGEMYAFLLATSLLKFSLSSLLMTVLGLIPIAIATNLLTIPVKVLGSMETEQMKQGLIGMAGVMGEMYAFLLATSLLKFNLSAMLTTILGLIPIAIAANLLTIPVKILGEMNPEQMKQGLIGMAGVMGEMLVFLLAVEAINPKITNSIATLTSCIGVSALIWILANSLESITDVPIDTIKTFIAGVDSMLIVLGACMLTLSNLPALNVLKVSAVLAAGIGMIGYVLDLLVGLFADTLIDKTEKLSEVLGPVSEGLALFSKNMEGVSYTSIESAAGALGLIAQMANTIPNSGGLLGFLAGDNDLSDFATKITDLGDGLVQFAAQTTGIDTTSMTAVIDVMKGIIDIATGSKDVKFSDLYLFKGFFEAFGSYYYLQDWEASANSIVNAFIVPLQNGMRTGVIAAVNSTAIMGVSMIRSYYSSFYNAGSYLAAGYSSGIRSGTSGAVQAASAMAAGSLNAVTATIDAHSPARKTFTLGGYFVDGFANALYKFAYKAADGAANLGERALDSTKAVVGSYMNVLLGGIDMTPTIRPVVDTSGVVSGIQSINGMFGGRTISLGSTFNRHISAINSGSSGSNKDVVAAIQALNSKFDNMNQSLSNMKIVLDDGTLVGHMAGGMDKQLGVLAGRRERGN